MPEPRTREEESVGHLRARLYEMTDEVQALKLEVNKHGVLLGVLTTELREQRSSMASREQLDHAVALTKAQLDHAVATLKSAISPVQKAVYWAIGLICAGVGGAIIQLVLKGQGH